MSGEEDRWQGVGVGSWGGGWRGLCGGDRKVSLGVNRVVWQASSKASECILKSVEDGLN